MKAFKEFYNTLRYTAKLLLKNELLDFSSAKIGSDWFNPYKGSFLIIETNQIRVLFRL